MGSSFESQDQMIDVVRIRALGGYRLHIEFSDGTAGEREFAPMVARDGEMLIPLKDPTFFARAFVELGAITWPNGYDLDPIALHDRMAAAGELRQIASAK